MNLLRGLTAHIPAFKAGTVVTVGNFDGIHIGHQAMLSRLVQKATELQLPSVVVVFEPQPQEFFQPNKRTARLTTLSEKILLLRSMPLHTLCCIRFNATLAALSAQDFIHDILLTHLNTRYLLVGDDFRFGQGRVGDFNLLQQQTAFSVERMATCTVADERVSSSRIRTALQQDDLALASACLGRPYFVLGKVRRGKQLGRTLGFPTANLALASHKTLLSGVYVVTVSGLGPKPLPAVANVGVRPTLHGKPERQLEVHLLDFQQDIYGRRICVNFLQKLRSEQKFESIDALKAQIALDVRKARTHHPLNPQ